MEKERRTKALVIVVLLIVIASLTVAFAALSTTLNINGTAYLDAAKWGIKFKNLSEPVSVGTATTTGTAKIEETKSAEITGINVSLSTPGDKVTYTVDLVNEGTINAKIDNIEKTVLTSEQQRYLIFKVTDNNEKEVLEGDILSAGETKNLTITVEFIKDLSKEDLPKQTSTISLSYKLNFVQTDEKAATSNSSSSSACTTFDKKDTYSVGDVIALCNTSTNKSEDFYVIKDDGTTVAALAKYNLLVGYVVAWNDDGDFTSVTPISSSEEGYGLQNSTAGYIEYDSDGNVLSHTIKATINFSSQPYWLDENDKLLSKYGTDSMNANVFDSNSLLYEPLQNYKNYLKNTLGKASVQTKLITYDELVSLGCNRKDYTCASAPSWVSSIEYWSATVTASGSAIYSPCPPDGLCEVTMNEANLNDPSTTGLRPVIIISKSEL